MITEINKALYEFWAQFYDDGTPIPAYLSGQVPKQFAFPYITFEVVAGSFASANFLTAMVWLREQSGHPINVQRGIILDQIAQAIPEGGRRITLDNNKGVLYLYRNSANFQSYFDDEDVETSGVRGGRTSYQVNYYT